MPNVLTYFWQAEITFALLFGLWWLGFRQTTLHRTNRVILLSILGLALLIPGVARQFPDDHQLLTTPTAWSLDASPWGPALEDAELATDEPTAPASTTTITWNHLLYLLAALCGLRLLWVVGQLGRGWWLVRKFPAREQHGLYYRYTHGLAGPSTFFRHVLLPADPPDDAVLAHEEVHARQGHSWDILLAELWLCLNWWNPLAYVYRRSLRQVHEYLADAHALRQVSKVSYLKALAAQSGISLQSTGSLSHAFTQHTLTKRLYMMKKNPTTTWRRAAYVALIPLAAGLTWAFRPVPYCAGVASIPETELLMSIPNPPDGAPIKKEDLTRLSSGFGIRRHPITKEKAFHKGVDFAAALGTPIYAAGSGEVLKTIVSTADTGHGTYVIIKHDNEYETMYSCMDEIHVAEGQRITKGTQIGTVGNTGMSTAPHLHYEVHQYGEPVDPINYLPDFN